MTWNHRIIKRDLKKPAYFAVHEVFYDEAGEITNWTAEAIDLTGENRKEILTILKQITLDIKTPILKESRLLEGIKAQSKRELAKEKEDMTLKTIAKQRDTKNTHYTPHDKAWN